MRWLLTICFVGGIGVCSKPALAVPAPAPLSKLVQQAEWIVVGKLGPLRPAAPGEKWARHGDIAVEEVLKGPKGKNSPKKLTLFTLDPAILKTPEAPAGPIMYSAGQRGIWLLEPTEAGGVYQARNLNSFLPIKRKREVGELLPIGGPKSNPPLAGRLAEVVVAQDGSKDCRTITEALARVQPGGKIQIHPGVYQESLQLEFSVNLVGVGDRDRIILRSTASDVVYFEAKTGMLSNLTLQSRATPKQEVYAVDVAAGHLVIENCDLSSTSLACLGVHEEETKATVTNCSIHDGADAGLFVYEGGTAELKDCQIFNNATGNVVVWANSQVVLEKCNLYGSPDVGLDLRKQGKATLTDCQIHQNQSGQLQIARNSQITIERCTIKDSLQTPDPPREKDQTQLIRILTSPSSTSKQLDDAVWKLDFGDEFAVEAVRKLLESEDPVRRAAGIHAVQRLGKVAEPTLDVLTKILATDTNFLRQSGAASAIGYMGTQDPKAVKALIGALSHSNEFIRESAARNLLLIGPPAALSATEELGRLQDDSSVSVAVTAAATKAGLTGDRDCVKAVMSKYVTKYSQRFLGEHIALSLGLAGLEGSDAGFVAIIFDTELKDENTTGREELAFALASLGPDVSIELEGLEKTLKDKEPLARWYAATALLHAKQKEDKAREVYSQTLPTMIAEVERHLTENTFPDRGKRTLFCKACVANLAISRNAKSILERMAKDAPDEGSRKAAKTALIRFQKKAT